MGKGKGDNKKKADFFLKIFIVGALDFRTRDQENWKLGTNK